MITNVNNNDMRLDPQYLKMEEGAKNIAKSPIDFIKLISKEKITETPEFLNKVVEFIDITDEIIIQNALEISKVYANLYPENKEKIQKLFKYSLNDTNIYEKLKASLVTKRDYYWTLNKVEDEFLLEISDENINMLDTTILDCLKDQIKVKIFLRDPLFKEQTSSFLEKYGDIVSSLDIVTAYTEADVNAILTFTPFITDLKIVGLSGSEVLKNLIYLKNLSIDGDYLLTDLTSFFPASLKSLSFHSNSKTKLPFLLPEHLETLSLNCPFLQEIPTPFPAKLAKLLLLKCNSLKKLPCLETSSLKKLEISDCKVLTELADTWPPNLEELLIENCNSLKKILNFKASSLKKLEISDCSTLTEIDTWSPNLEELILKKCKSISKLPNFWSSSLKKLVIENCEVLKEVSETWSQALLHLELKGCSSLKRVPKNWGESITYLLISGCLSLTTLPDSLPSNLVTFIIADAPFLEEISWIWPETLETITLMRCDFLRKLPEWSLKLQQLWLYQCDLLKEIPEVWSPNLLKLKIDKCKSLKKLPPSFPETLNTISIYECKSLTGLPDTLPPKLETFLIWYAPFLTEIKWIWPDTLKRLEIVGCEFLIKLPDYWSLNLQELELDWCERLEEIPNEWPPILMSLHIDKCNSIKKFPLDLPQTLEILWIKECKSFSVLPEKFPDRLFQIYLDSTQERLAKPQLTLQTIKNDLKTSYTNVIESSINNLSSKKNDILFYVYKNLLRSEREIILKTAREINRNHPIIEQFTQWEYQLQFPMEWKQNTDSNYNFE